MRIKPAGKLILFILAIGVAFGLWRVWNSFGDKLIPSATTTNTQIPKVGDLPNADGSGETKNVVYTAPGSDPGCADKPEVRMLVWAWNAQMGLMLANGGAQATQGSQMCKNGVNLRLIRQDDVSKMQADLIAFATELSQGEAQPKNGAHFVAIMGDGAAAFLKALNDNLKRLGPEYTAKVIGSAGYSRGEDKFMGPPEWKSSPSASRGGVVTGVLRDGDWNIAQKWLSDNGLPTNPDEKTYDPDALNWVAANDYIDAAQKYIAGYSETRPVVRNGKRTGETKQITVNGVVTWTPGDVNVAKNKGGLVSIVSTKEYTYQMPNVIIGIDKWMKQNRSTVEGFLQAVCDAGDQVQSRNEALQKAAEISAAVYKEEDAAYWQKYYKGVQEPDKTGMTVDLGGSKVNNLADNAVLFGLGQGTTNIFAATYKIFGDIVVTQYPQLVPNYPPVGEILDTSYIKALLGRGGQITQKELKQTARSGGGVATGQIKKPVSRKSWQIAFDTGKATFRPEAQRTMERLLQDLVIAGGTAVEVHGHTDNVGDPTRNLALSESRAFAVKNWLEKRATVNFPEGRIRVIAHGQTQPLVPNVSEQNRARNRRVEIKLGTTE